MWVEGGLQRGRGQVSSLTSTVSKSALRSLHDYYDNTGDMCLLFRIACLFILWQFHTYIQCILFIPLPTPQEHSLPSVSPSHLYASLCLFYSLLGTVSALLGGWPPSWPDLVHAKHSYKELMSVHCTSTPPHPPPLLHNGPWASCMHGEGEWLIQMSHLSLSSKWSLILITLRS